MTHQQWNPDTCNCSFQVNHDWTEHEVLKKCTAHAAFSTEEVFEQVLEKENKVKNRLCSYLEKKHGSQRIKAMKDANLAEGQDGFSPIREASVTNCPIMAAYGLKGTLTFDAERNIILSDDEYINSLSDPEADELEFKHRVKSNKEDKKAS